MKQRVQLSTEIDPEIKKMLEHMRIDDRRTLKGQIEYLVLEEHKRRQQTLTDTRATYEAN